MLSRLMPWMRLHYLKSKGMKISKENSHRGISQTKEIKLIMWTCTVSAPEMSVMLYNLNGLVLYHVSCFHSIPRVRTILRNSDSVLELAYPTDNFMEG